MIKLICEDGEGLQTLQICEFFNTIGMHVNCQSDVDLRGELRKFNIVRYENQLADATVYFSENKEKHGDVNICEEETVTNNIKKILEYLEDSHRIKRADFDQLINLCDLLTEEENSQLLLLMNEKCESECAEKIAKSAFDLINKVIDLLQRFGIKVWGSSDALYLKFAIACLSYRLNEFCKRCAISMMVEPDSIVKTCELIFDFCSDSLKDEVMLLQANTYMNLIAYWAHGYEALDIICNNNKIWDKYNDARPYFAKAEHWSGNAKDYEKAKKFLVKALQIESNDYKIWYALGVACKKSGNKSEALVAFNAAIKLLLQRQCGNYLQVCDKEYLFNSYWYCGMIYRSMGDYGTSLKLLNKAEELYNNLGAEYVCDLVPQFTQSLEAVRNDAMHSLNISQMREVIREIKYIRKLDGFGE